MSGIKFFVFQAELSFVVLDEAEGSLTKQKHRRSRKGFGQDKNWKTNKIIPNPEQIQSLDFLNTF